MLDPDSIAALAAGRHGDPFAVLGAHADAAGARWLRAFLPGAAEVEAWSADGARRLAVLAQRHDAGFFEARVETSDAHCWRVRWHDGNLSTLDDPYRFAPLLGELDVWLMREGTHLRPYEVLGATPRELLGVAGTAFAVWAPNARRVSVVGDFNHWN
ncbi:MAG: 1,4-alpha-glucan branching enzyme, partial [Burkholderiales bacterium]|nr:1,4-alpha-glucan branching enzyme [Burkholderiales bacterium]